MSYPADKKVAISEFRDNFSKYLLTSESPMAITRYGSIIGHYFPVPRTRSIEERLASNKALDRWQKAPDESDIEEEDFTNYIHECRKLDQATGTETV